MGANGIYGLSGSGLDIDSMVKVGMLKKQNTYDKMYQQQMKSSWVKAAYADLYKSMNSFKQSMSNFNKQSTMSAMSATTSDVSTVTASANGAAAAMNHKVSVEKLASNAYMLSTENITRASGTTSSYNLSDVAFKKIEAKGSGYEVTLADGTTKTVNGDDKAISFKIGNGNETKEISYTYDELAKGEKTLYDLATDINDAGLDISAKYDATTEAFSLYNKNGGEKNKITIDAEGDAGTIALLNNLHLGETDGEDLKEAHDFNDALDVKGGYAVVKIDGKTYSNLEGNSLTVAGVTYTFNNVSDKDSEGKFKSTTVTVSQNTDSIVDSVKSFVEEYNKLLDSLQEKYNETPYSDYKPLTKNQEAQMTESQIKAWNEKAKSGLLYHDSKIRDIISDMRSALSTPVDSVNSKYNSASALGITTTDVKGHITFDEDKLKAALAADPDCAYQVFGKLEYTKENGKETNKIDTRNTGIANRLYFNVSSSAIDKIKEYAGTTDESDDNSYLGKLITNMQTKMDSFKTQMSAYEKLLYKRYDAMEVALSKLGTTMSYITG